MYSRYENVLEKFKSPTVTSYTDVIRRITDTTQTHRVSFLFDINNKYMKLGVN
jgi:hypothetical protein